MKEINKLKKIYKGFFPDETVSDTVKEKRRALCGACEYNSANTPSDKLSPIDYLRDKITGPPFCTLCKCQIHEKTQSPFEECAAYMADEPKKWLKTRLETMEKNNINITNLSNVEVDLTLQNEKFVVDYGVLTRNDETDIELLIDTNTDEKFKLHSVTPYCGCSVTKFENKDNKGYVFARMNMGMINPGKFSKQIDVEYILGNLPHKAVLLLTGFKK